MKPERRTPGGNRANAKQSAGTAHTNCTSAEQLLARVDGVRQTGPDQWIARCPAHDDCSPSLSIRNAGDRILIHCFAGCEPGEIMAVLGLTLADLFEKPAGHNCKPLSRYQRARREQALDALQALEHEINLVWIFAEQMQTGFALDLADRERLLLAMGRIKTALRMVA